MFRGQIFKRTNFSKRSKTSLKVSFSGQPSKKNTRKPINKYPPQPHPKIHLSPFNDTASRAATFENESNVTSHQRCQISRIQFLQNAFSFSIDENNFMISTIPEILSSRAIQNIPNMLGYLWCFSNLTAAKNFKIAKCGNIVP